MVLMADLMQFFPYCQGLGGAECGEDRENDAWGDQSGRF